jgi:MFS family permease
MQSPQTPSETASIRIDWLPSIIVGILMLFSAVGAFYLAIYFKEDLHYSGTQIGALFALQATTGVLAALPAGFGNDRITSRTMIAVGLVLQAAGFALLGYVHAFGWLLVVFVVWSLMSSVLKLSLDVQVLKTDNGERTGSRLGLYQAWRYAGSAVGTIAIGYIIAVVGFEKALFISGAACLLLIPLTYWLPPTKVARVRLSDYHADLRKPQVLLFGFWMFLFTTHWGAEYTCYGPFLRSNLHLDMIDLGWYMSAEYVAIFAAALLAGRALDRTGRIRGFALVGLLASGIGTIGMVFPPVAMSVSFRALHGLGDGVMIVVLYLGIARLFSIERMGGNTGVVSMATMLGFVVGALVYGWLGDFQGYAMPLWISGILSILLALPLLTWRLTKSLAR